jgi:hypothetical protein
MLLFVRRCLDCATNDSPEGPMMVSQRRYHCTNGAGGFKWNGGKHTEHICPECKSCLNEDGWPCE